MTLSLAQVLINIKATLTNSLDLATSASTLNTSRGPTLANGTGANQVNMVFHDQRTLADAANETLDLNDGSLTDALGVALTLETLKVLYIKNTSVDANLLIGGAGANSIGLFGDVSDIISLPPGGELLITAPDATGIDISTNSDLKLEHDGTGSSNLVYDIIALGVD